jgi:Na+/H+ antiporter NhaD/arsenite permease-like protein
MKALESIGILQHFVHFLETALGNIYFIDSAMGAISAVFNNISLVAAEQAMYSFTKFPANCHFWELLALTTGTGGSILIIGSAAGVGAMRIVKINFMEYLRKISWLAIAEFVSGILLFLLEVKIFNFLKCRYFNGPTNPIKLKQCNFTLDTKNDKM